MAMMVDAKTQMAEETGCNGVRGGLFEERAGQNRGAHGRTLLDSGGMWTVVWG